MQRVFRWFEELVSVTLVFFGIVICMCETPDADEQLLVILLGSAIIAIGTLIGLASMEVRDGRQL